jgi:thymidylate synthase (FAD)
MKVSLIAHTGNADALAGQAAAICTGAMDWGKALRHALESGHESVAEHASFTFRIEGVSRALLAQLTRHRIASFSVKSQRYVDMGDMPYVTPPCFEKNPALKAYYHDLMHMLSVEYQHLVSLGVPKEDARFIMPQAACTDLIVTMNARELRHFFSLRCCNRAQWEIRALADQMLALCKEKAPALFENAGPGCVRGECPEKRPCGKPRGGNKE